MALVHQLKKEDVLEIELDLTGTCNLDCPLCTRNYVNAKHLLKYNERSVEEIIQQLDEYPNIKNCCMAGIISEPTLYKRFFELISYLVKREIELEIYSNASVHGPEWWGKLAKLLSPRDKVFFTVCGSTQELHEKYRVGSSLKKVLENHAAFKAACPYPIDYVQHIRFDYNREDFESPAMQEIMSRFSNDASIDSLPYNERFGFIPDEANRIKMTADLARHYKLISDSAKKRYFQNKTGEISCKMRCKSLETKFIAIDQFGEIYPCFLYRIYNTNEKFDLNYEKINKFTYDFCYECESMTTFLLEKYSLERMG
ncbi:radical SAM protein [Peredibacter sp. HCB2-198]|uniref:radical SAM protein n=1 Tax=Peredibacter sp. HCB2-198 TaxID=3383025 RepID=UPI0038B4D51D